MKADKKEQRQKKNWIEVKVKMKTEATRDNNGMRMKMIEQIES